MRLLLGLSLLAGLLLTSPAELSDPDGLFWLLSLYALWSLHHLFDVLLDRDWGRLPQGIFLVLVAVAGGLDFLLYGRVWAAPLAWLVYLVDLVVLGGLAGSFLLAAIWRVPGCEWRALPYLIAQARDQPFEPHPCSLYLHRLDRWEAGRTQS